MDTLQKALYLVTKDCFMAYIDMKDAYYSVPVCEEHRKLWQFDGLPNGLVLALRKFTMLLKSGFATSRGQMSHLYILSG